MPVALQGLSGYIMCMLSLDVLMDSAQSAQRKMHTTDIISSIDTRLISSDCDIRPCCTA